MIQRPSDLVLPDLPVRSQWPVFEADEVEAAAAVLRSGKVNRWTGEECNRFEKEYADYLGVPHVISLANGTLALELALHALGIGAGDEVITTPRSFFATAGCIVLSGAKAVFADIDPQSQNITAESIAAVITPRTRAVIVVHLAGWPADMEAICALGRERGIAIIEDCAQAHGASWKGRPVGSWGDLAAFSFCQDKIMTTGGEGGLLALKDEAQWKKCWAYKEHGKNPDKVFGPHAGSGFRWLHDGFGSNWRLTEMQAAIGRLQLRKLDGWIAHRRDNARYLDERFSALPALEVTRAPAEAVHAYYKYYVKVRPGVDRDALQSRLVAMGIPTFVGSCPEMFREEAFVKLGGDAVHTPVAAEFGLRSLMFQVDPTLTLDHMRRIADAVEQALREMGAAA